MENLKGKKINILGDSVTAGVGAYDPDCCYVNYFRKISGADVESNGVSGTRIAIQHDPSKSYEPSFNRHFASRLSEMRNDADVVVIFGGTNDFGHGDAPFGKIGDKTPDTFCGALYDLYSKMRAKYPTAKIMVITPMHRMTENDTTNENGLSCQPLSAYVDAIRQTANAFSMPVLDFFAADDVYKVDEDEQFFRDKVHPTDAGHKRIAQCLFEFILKL